MKPTAIQVCRTEAAGEPDDWHPSLVDAMRDDPTHAEAIIATSPCGIVLAEATIRSSSRKRTNVHYEWRLTVAGADVIDGGVRGMRAAS